MPKKIGVITDMTLTGSGYFYIFTNLAKGLAERGYEISVAGLGYMGEPHPFPFSVIPCQSLQDGISILQNLIFLKQVDMILVAMDIPIQMQLFQSLQSSGKPYMAITPMENGPLVDEWAMALSQMQSVFFISEFAKQEAIVAGVTKAEHLWVGVDTTLWHPPSAEERKQLRQGLGFEDDETVVLTVADNQERKNLWAGMRIVEEFVKATGRKARYVLVTKEDSYVGWRLRSLAKDCHISKEYLPFQRGIPTHDLWGLYACADVYLQPSKAEGLGLPVMEAMACGVPCVATDTGALHELLTDGRGYLVKPDYEFIDVWGNSKRSMISIEVGAKVLELMEPAPVVARALEYVRGRTWDKPVQQVADKIAELFNEPTQAQKE